MAAHLRLKTRGMLRPYQVKAVDFIKRNPCCALWLDMGLGKTVSTATALLDLINLGEVQHVLIIAPKRVAQHTWQAELSEWAHVNHLSMAIAVGTEYQRLNAIRQKAQITCINRENVEWLEKTIKRNWYWDTVVIDEASSFKSPSSKRTKSLARVFKHMGHVVKRVIQLTGTPASNGYLNIWSQIYLLDKGERLLKNYTAYQTTYFQPDYSGYRWSLRDGAEQIIQRRVSDLTMVLQAKDYIDLPDMIPVFVPVTLSSGEMDTYQELQRDYLFTLDDKAVVAANAAVLHGKLTQLATGDVYDENRQVVHIHDRKLEALRDLVDELQGKPVLLAYNYQHERDKILKAFGKQAQEIKTVADIERWNHGRITVALAHPQSIGHGLNLQRGGHNIIWYSVPFDLEIYLQFNKRLHRSGQANKVMVYHLVTQDTVEEQVTVPRLQAKDLNQQELVQGVLRYAQERLQKS